MEWLMLGVGEMLKTKRTTKTQPDNNPSNLEDKVNEILPKIQSSNPMIDRLFDLLTAKDKEIGDLREETGRLKARIEELERERQVPITPRYVHSTSKETVEP